MTKCCWAGVATGSYKKVAGVATGSYKKVMCAKAGLIHTIGL